MLQKRLATYAKSGETVLPRPISRAGIPAHFETSKHRPYQWLPLYNDTTEKELLEWFCYFKRLRIQYLKRRGIRVRKHITSNLFRDHEWFQMAQRDLKRGIAAPDYRAIAEQWSQRNPVQVRKMFLRHAWRSPEVVESLALRGEIERAKVKGEIYESFEKKCGARDQAVLLKEDLQAYIRSHLPHLIRSAVQRYKPSC